MSNRERTGNFDYSGLVSRSTLTSCSPCTADTEQIRQFLDLVFPISPGAEALPYHYGIRTRYLKKTENAFQKRVFEKLFDRHDPAVDFACGRSEREETIAVWVTINPVDATTWSENQKATCDANIIRRHAFFIDFDNERPAYTNATDAERERSLKAATACQDWLTEQGFPEPINCDSGNGHHLLYGTDMPVDDRGLVEEFLKRLAAKFSGDGVKVDTVVHNPGRVCKLPGTFTRKAPHTPERPQRLARLIQYPRRLEPVPQELLRAVVGVSFKPKPSVKGQAAEQQVEADSKNTQSRRAEPVSRGVDIRKLRIDSVLTYLQAVGIEVAGVPQKEKEDFTVINLPYCPFKTPEHTDGGTGILVYDSGRISVKCFHEKCDGGTWAKLQEAFDLKFDEVVDESATQAIMGTTTRKVSDPLELAHVHNRKWFTEDGTPTLVCFGEDTHRYNEDEGWVPTKPRDLAPWVRATVQEVFDEHARIISALKGTPIKPRPVNGDVVNETIRAMESLCRREILTTDQPPIWLNQVVDWDSDDLLVFRNNIVSIRRYCDGQDDYWIPRTPKLFYEGQAAFAFTPTTDRPNEWHRFLESLEQSEEWYTLLQQIMGYCLLPSYDLQKYFMIVGPPRCGKGTITRVLENLVGGPGVVCSLNLKNFATEFGLEKAIGKRLALVPEIHMPAKEQTEIINNLKAITGGDLVSVNRKKIREVSLRLPMKIIMSTNNFVALPDNSGALQARVLPIKLTKSFVGKEDLDLAKKLKPEYPGILIWALDGLKKLIKDGGKFTLPQSTLDELEQLADSSAPLQTFVQECCHVNLTQGVRSPALYEIYKTWNQQANPGIASLSDAEFADELRATVSTISKKKASKPNVQKQGDCHIVQTDFDGDRSGRPNLWFGICPKPVWRVVRGEP